MDVRKVYILADRSATFQETERLFLLQLSNINMQDSRLGEGFYVSDQQRNEIQKAFYRTHFRTSQALPQPLTTTQKTHFQAHVGTKRALKGQKSSIFQSNWSLGNEKREMETELSANFKPVDLKDHLNAQKQAVGDRQNYHECHFSLGNAQFPTETASQSAYPSYKVTQCPNRHTQHSEQRRLQLGTDVGDYSTEAHKGLTLKKSDITEVRKRRQAAKTRNETTSVVLGSQFSDLRKSSSALAFDWKPQDCRPDLVKQESHVDFGTEQPRYESFSQESYTAVAPAKANFQATLLADLHKSHFRFGEYRETPVSKDAISEFQASVPCSQTQTSSVHLGSFSASWESSSAVAHKPLPVAHHQPVKKDTVTASHISLGSEVTSLKSVSQDLFDDSLKKDPKAPSLQAAKIHKTTVELGQWPAEYTLISESYGQGANHPTVSTSFNTDSCKHHFQLGFSPLSFERSSTQAKPTHMTRVSLDSKTLKRLTNTSALIGHSKERSFDSTYSHSFLWVHPKVDQHYSVSYS